MIKGMEHVALSVQNLDRSLSFYKDLLGMDVVRQVEAGPEMGLGDIVGIPGCSARIAHLEIAGFMLELFEYTDPRGIPLAEDRTQADHGFTHLGFTSTDARSDYASLKDAGVEFLGEPVEFRPGVWVVYFYGPDREVCELRQA
jgi:lactoylglutathione lyase